MYFSLKSAVVMTWKALCSSSHDRCAQLLLELCEAAKNKWNLQILGWIQLLGICAATEEDGDWWQGSSPWSARAGASRGSFASCRAKGWVWTSQAMSSWCVCLCTSLLVIILGRAEITPQLWEQPCSHVKGSRTRARRSTPSLRAALVFVRKKKKKLQFCFCYCLSHSAWCQGQLVLNFKAPFLYRHSWERREQHPCSPAGGWKHRGVPSAAPKCCCTGHRAGLAQPFYWGFPSSSHILRESPLFFSFFFIYF